MKINWKVRLKNPAFWMAFVPTLATFVYTTLALFDIAPAISESEIIEFATIVVSVLAGLGILVDPTTKGISDSEKALTYDKPN